MIAEAIISGSIERALYRDEGGLWLLASGEDSPRPANARDVAIFRATGRELSYADPAGLPVTLETVAARLASEVEFFRALDGVLVGMDPDYSNKVRTASIRAAEAILIDEGQLLNRVRQRVLMPTNSQEWDASEALALAQSINARRVAAIYSPIADGTVDLVADALSAAISKINGTGAEAMEIREGLFGSGLISQLCIFIINRDEKGLKGMAFRLREFPEVARLDPNGRIILASTAPLVDEITEAKRNEEVPSDHLIATRDNETKRAETLDGLKEAVLAFLETWAHRRRKGASNEYIDVLSVQREIEWIADRVRDGRIQAAKSALAQLIRHQSGKSDPAHLAKSLTNVAGQAQKTNQPEFCLELLDLVDLLDARDATAAGVRGLALQDLNRFRESLTILREAIARFPDNEVTSNAYAKLLRYMGRHDEALAILDETMARFPNDEVTRNAYAELLRDMGRQDEAQVIFEETMARFPNDVVASNAYAELLRDSGRYDKALGILEETMARFPQSAVTRNTYAKLQRDIGHHDEAQAIFEEAVARFPNSEVTRNGYAELLREMGRHDEAQAIFEETMARFPHDVVSRNGYAELLRDMGRHDEAQAIFEETMARFPFDEVTRNAYAELLREMGRHDEAQAIFEETMARFPHNVVAPTAYAELLRDMGRYEEARAVFEETMARFPNKKVTRNAYAELLREMGRHDEAQAIFEETMARFPHDVVAPTAYAELLREMGRHDEAQAIFEETMARFPQGAVTRNAYAHFLVSSGKFALAEELLKPIVKMPVTVQDWIALHILGMSFLRQGQTRKALEIFERGAANPSKRVGPYFRSGCVMAHLAMEQPALARETLDKVSREDCDLAVPIRLLSAHVHGAAGDIGEAEEILIELPRGGLSRNEMYLADSLKEFYVLKAVPKERAAAANDNILDLEMRVIFRAMMRNSLRLVA